MRYSRVTIESIGYELAPNVVTSADLEDRLAPVYDALKLPSGQIAALTGVRERRFWDAGQRMADGAARAGRKALAAAGVGPDEIGMLVYGGVCRDNLEPATACATADALGIGGQAVVHDTCNACLGVMNALFQVANAIELGQIRVGMVVSCESARPIVDLTIERMVRDPSMEMFKKSMATMTGGSGAIGIVLTDAPRSPGAHRLVGGVIRAAPQHHALSRWGPRCEYAGRRPGGHGNRRDRHAPTRRGPGHRDVQRTRRRARLARRTGPRDLPPGRGAPSQGRPERHRYPARPGTSRPSSTSVTSAPSRCRSPRPSPMSAGFSNPASGWVSSASGAG